uniref:Uncharacterized protein n=1 Tax=viral metagenome TaxID=1070528 RepID=A0A6H1ZQR6_9ZZZZ
MPEQFADYQSYQRRDGGTGFRKPKASGRGWQYAPRGYKPGKKKAAPAPAPKPEAKAKAAVTPASVDAKISSAIDNLKSGRKPNFKAGFSSKIRQLLEGKAGENFPSFKKKLASLSPAVIEELALAKGPLGLPAGLFAEMFQELTPAEIDRQLKLLERAITKAVKGSIGEQSLQKRRKNLLQRRKIAAEERTIQTDFGTKAGLVGKHVDTGFGMLGKSAGPLAKQAIQDWKAGRDEGVEEAAGDVARVSKLIGPEIVKQQTRKPEFQALKKGLKKIFAAAKKSTEGSKADPNFKSKYPQINVQELKNMLAAAKKSTEESKIDQNFKSASPQINVQDIMRDLSSKKPSQKAKEVWSNVIVPAAKQIGVSGEDLFKAWQEGIPGIERAIGDVAKGIKLESKTIKSIMKSGHEEAKKTGKAGYEEAKNIMKSGYEEAKKTGVLGKAGYEEAKKFIKNIPESKPIKAVGGISEKLLNAAVEIPGKFKAGFSSLFRSLRDTFKPTPGIVRATPRRKKVDSLLGRRNIPETKIPDYGTGPLPAPGGFAQQKTSPKKPLTQKQIDSLASQGFDTSKLVSGETRAAIRAKESEQKRLTSKGFAPGSEQRIAPSMRRVDDIGDVERVKQEVKRKGIITREEVERSREADRIKPVEETKTKPLYRQAVTESNKIAPAKPPVMPKNMAPQEFEKTILPTKLPAFPAKKKKIAEKLRFGLPGKRASEFMFNEFIEYFADYQQYRRRDGSIGYRKENYLGDWQYAPKGWTPRKKKGTAPAKQAGKKQGAGQKLSSKLAGIKATQGVGSISKQARSLQPEHRSNLGRLMAGIIGGYIPANEAGEYEGGDIPGISKKAIALANTIRTMSDSRSRKARMAIVKGFRLAPESLGFSENMPKRKRFKSAVATLLKAKRTEHYDKLQDPKHRA